MGREQHWRILTGTWRTMRLAMLAGLLGLLTCGSIPGDEPAGRVEETRTAIEQWVETQKVISLEKRDLALAQEMLNERIAVVQREIDTLREKIDQASGSIAEAERKAAELVAENDRLRQASSSLLSAIAMLETRTLELVRQLPDPVRERIKPLSQRLPAKPEETKLAIGERFQNVVGILNEVNKASREIAVTSEVRTLPDGTAAEVTALYLGIGQAYYIGANDSVAGIGRPAADGWVWQPANEAAPQIAQAIAILKNEQVAAFVQLPVEVK